MRIGWKLFALFRFNILSAYVYYSLFPIEFEDGTVKSKRSTYTQSVRAAFTVILHRLKSSNPLRVRNEPVQVVCACACVCDNAVRMARYASLFLSLCVFLCVRVFEYIHTYALRSIICSILNSYGCGAPRNKTRLAYNTLGSASVHGIHMCVQANMNPSKTHSTNAQHSFYVAGKCIFACFSLCRLESQSLPFFFFFVSLSF